MSRSTIQENDPIGVYKPLYDVRRCLQFIRHHADELNVDKSRIGAYGSSAGAGTALWLGFHDDMADPGNADSVLHESTRLRVVAAKATQATYDIVKWFDVVFIDFGITIDMLQEDLTHRLLDFYAISDTSELYTPQTEAYRADVDMLALMSADDPPIWVENNQEEGGLTLQQGLFYHHPMHAKVLDEYADSIGLTNRIYAPAINLVDSTGEQLLHFFLEHL